MGKKQKLSRGIDDLFSDNVLEDTPQAGEGEQIVKLRIGLIEPNAGQPRGKFDDEALEELSASIRENGILQPILVRPLDNGDYQIVAGERRWRAARLAGLEEVPVYVKNLSDKETMQLALIENIQRQDLTPLEEALAYQNLMDSYDMTQKEVAKVVGKSRSAVANSLRLLNLSDEVKTLLEEEKLTAGHAKVLVGLDREEQEYLAQIAVDSNLSVRELEKMANFKMSDKDDKDTEKNLHEKNSIKYERPFLKEFEAAVNASSAVRVKVKDDKNGGTAVSLSVGKEIDIEKFLTEIGKILEKY